MEYLRAIKMNPATFIRQLAVALEPINDIKLAIRPLGKKRKPSGKPGRHKLGKPSSH